MAYTMLKNTIASRNYPKNGLEEAVLSFIRDRCQGLRFDKKKSSDIHAVNLDTEGTGITAGQIPLNMEKILTGYAWRMLSTDL